MGLLVVQLSNVGFSARAVFAKTIKKQHPESGSATSSIVLFYHISRIGLALLVPSVVFDWSAIQEALADPSFDLPRLLGTMCFNGVFYSLYNLFSFIVLSRVSTSTHAVLNVFRRVVVIMVDDFLRKASDAQQRVGDHSRCPGRSGLHCGQAGGSQEENCLSAVAQVPVPCPVEKTHFELTSSSRHFQH